MATATPENVDISKITEVPVLLKLWEEKYQESPLPILKRLAEIVEAENDEFLKLDPDPYDDRHPSRTHPSCPLGATLKSIFKKENLISKLMRDYLKDDLDVCIAAARVFIAILPGLETSIVYQETEGLINRLFTWAEKGPEPLQSYALGLLGASMEVPEVAGKFKDRNLRLVPQMLKRLKCLQDEFLSLHRPFAQFSSKSDVLEDIDCSSSSWAEMEMNIIGTFQVYPVNLASRQIFTLRYLAPLGEYQEMLSSAFESNAMGIILKYLQRGKDTRLIFEAMKYLSALLCHKKFAIEFIDCGGLQRLLTTPRPSISATGVSMCLYYIAYSEDAMEKVCLLSKDVLQSLVNYAMWLLECSHNSGRNHAIMFFGVVYHFKLMLDLFDSNDGLRRILNVISTAPNILGGDDISEEEQSSCRQAFRQVSYNLRRYFESHLAFFGERLKSTVDKDGSYHVTPYKPLRTSLEKQRLLHEQILDRIPQHYRWQPVERFLKLNGMQAMMQVIAMAYDWNYTGRNETVKNTLDVIAICCLSSKAQLLLTERFQLQGSTATGTSIILNASEGEVVSDVEVQKSALQILINCVNGKKSDTLTKLWESIRLNNGILILTRLLNTKIPITEADYIRALACKCLSGLARYKVICQILEQLPLIGQLKVLMREPILQEKRQDHVMFQKYALEILKNFYGEEYEIDLVRKNDLVSTVVDYNEGQLYELILGHLKDRGFTDTVKVFESEMNKVRSRKKDEKPESGGRVETPKKKLELKRTASRKFEKPTMYNNKKVTLDGIVKEYLLNQHALCKTPMATCPPFDLLIRHKCPSENIRKVNYKSPSVNFVERMTRFQTFGGGVKFTDRDRRIAFSKFKPFRVIRSETEDNFTTASFSSCYQWMIAGNTQGEIKLYNINNSTVEGTYPCHESEIYHIQPNSKGNLLLTSSTWRRPLSALWKMESLFDKIVEFDKDEYAEFSKLAQDKVISTNMDHCRVTDIETQKEILNLEPTASNQYLKNRATFDPHDDLILSDGVLFDFKSGKEIHKFDKLNENFNGVFNPTGLEIISNSEIWDIRTFHLLKTVRLFDQMQLTFTNCGNIVYGVKCDSLDTSFVSFDSMYYESIGTVQVKRQILNLCTSPNDLQIALVENATNEDVNDSCIRFYEVGRSREDEDEPTEEDDDEDMQSEASESNEEEEDNDIDRLLEELLPEGDIVDGLFEENNSDENSENSSDSSESNDDDESDGSDSE